MERIAFRCYWCQRNHVAQKHLIACLTRKHLNILQQLNTNYWLQGMAYMPPTHGWVLPMPPSWAAWGDSNVTNVAWFSSERLSAELGGLGGQLLLPERDAVGLRDVAHHVCQAWRRPRVLWERPGASKFHPVSRSYLPPRYGRVLAASLSAPIP